MWSRNYNTKLCLSGSISSKFEGVSRAAPRSILFYVLVLANDVDFVVVVVILVVVIVAVVKYDAKL